MRTKKETRRQKIIETAAQIFRENGFERTSMSEIATRLGGSKGTLYSYFRSKEDLFGEVVTQRADAYMNDILSQSMDGADVADTLRTLGEKILCVMFSSEFVTINRNVLAEAGTSDIGRVFYERGPLKVLKRLAAILESWMREGKLREADPVVVAKQLIALLEAEVRLPILLGVLDVDTDVEVAPIVGRALDVFVRAYVLPA
ncbi:TetR/AcrR family transcriptional regulator [Paludibacterium yongneupense]|uniref:TetR/AcrR family transcriptional regulator n=2 Tax=Paludibacterium yongneupense TaxID=400061 RepID=UPI000490E7FE|nr:TetR/AcrR family transcriptional regulator [Paludibacterium yongneupense]